MTGQIDDVFITLTRIFDHYSGGDPVGKRRHREFTPQVHTTTGKELIINSSDIARMASSDNDREPDLSPKAATIIITKKDALIQVEQTGAEVLARIDAERKRIAKMLSPQ